MNTNHISLLLIPVFATALMAGCASPSNNIQTSAKPPEPVNAKSGDEATTLTQEPMRSAPQKFARVVIVPIWFSVAANCDSSFTSNQLAQVTGNAGRETASIFAKEFGDSGYQVVNPLRIICSDEDIEAFDADTRQLLAQARAEVWQLGEEIRQATSAQVPNPAFHYKLKSSISPLATQLGGTTADALVLVDMTASLETPRHRHKRYAWNGTGAPLLTAVGYTLAFGVGMGSGMGAPTPGTAAFMRSKNYIQQTIAVVDLHNQKVLLWNSITNSGTDLREPGQLKVAITDLLAGLPQVTEKNIK